MTKKNEQFDFETKKYPIEDALAKLFGELALVVRRVRIYIGRKPKDNFEKMIKAGELLIWTFLTYDLIRSFLNWR